MAGLWGGRQSGHGRVCEVADGRLVEFRFTKGKSSGTAALEKAEGRLRVVLCRRRRAASRKRNSNDGFPAMNQSSDGRVATLCGQWRKPEPDSC